MYNVVALHNDTFLVEMARWRARCEAGALAEAARHPVAPQYLGGVYARLRAA